MALIKLLAVGRSWSEPKDRPHRYKVKSGVLPTFGKAASPIAEGPADSNAETVVDQGPRVAAGAGKEICGTKIMKAGLIAEPMHKTGVAQSGTSLRGWSWKMNPFRVRSAKQPAIAPRQTLQGELSLDKVKVKRNDLSDSDLEVVPMIRPNVFAAPAAAAEEKVGKHSLLSRFASRLFRRNQN